MFILRPSMNEASSPQIQASSSVSDTAIHHLSAYMTFNHQKIKEIGKRLYLSF
jgi:hypothetical protein